MNVRIWGNIITRGTFRSLFVSMTLLATACTTTGTQGPSKAAQEIKPTTDPSEITAQVERAEGALAYGELRIAKTLFQDVLMKDPENERARLGAAEVLLAFRDLDPAAKSFAALEGSITLGSKARQGQGIALLLKGRHDKAQALLEAAVDGDPNLWRAWNALGQIHDSHNEWAQSQHSYEQALAANPSAAIIHNNMGFSLLLQGRAREATEAFRAAYALNPNLDLVRNNLRLALAGQGEYAEALAGADSKHEAMVMNNVGYLAMVRQDFGKAEALLMEAMSRSPSHYEKASQNLQNLQVRKKCHSVGQSKGELLCR